VDGEYDRGRILDSEAVPVLPGDTPEDVQKRVYAAEMALYPRALAAYLKLSE
jgi:folate-dependent phosphoribosylglycinamide formyltransferase PurN